LPGARQEAELIRKFWPQAQLFVGPAATKQALLQMVTPGILHIATHGHFLEDAKTSSSTRSVGVTGELAGAGPGQPPPDPLLRSYLVLAGANPHTTSSDKVAQPRLEDSLVTALELAGLNLWGTQLVVLSACDTGQGDVKIGQGVYGLRRAFAVAGAETLVTSLWKVDDGTTRELMEAYYRGLLGGQGRAAAMQAAMREIRDRHPHPYDWAPFIVVGSGAPLRGVNPAHP
jgi:CHAT domain-containing protein